MTGNSSQHDPHDPDGRIPSSDAQTGETGSREGDSLFVGMGTICDTVARLTGVDGAAVAVLTPSGTVRELVHATNALAQQLDELQFTLGEGPCLDAYRHDRAQLWADLEDREYAQRWPMFSTEVAELGVAALFAFPVPGTLRPMGVLELYRTTAGALTDHELETAQMCATAIRVVLQANWDAHVTRSGSSSAAFEVAALHGAAAPRTGDPFTRSQVHVAAGMLAVQLKVSTQDGIARLRAYAYAEKRSVLAVAADVVSRRLSFEHLDGEQGNGREPRQ